jgi:hypothetical protein
MDPKYHPGTLYEQFTPVHLPPIHFKQETDPYHSLPLSRKRNWSARILSYQTFEEAEEESNTQSSVLKRRPPPLTMKNHTPRSRKMTMDTDLDDEEFRSETNTPKSCLKKKKKKVVL